MPEAAAQPFVTSPRPSGVASRAATQEPAKGWTWQATPNPTTEAGWTTTWPARPGYNAAGEQNKLGNYYCWNRIYEPSTGRWTTPDPAAKPWGNLWDYAHSGPAQATDPSGLFGITITTLGSPPDDGVEQALNDTFGNASRSCADFVSLLASAWVAAGECISKITLVGHCGTGYGGGCGVLSEGDKRLVSMMLCDGVEIRNEQCYGYLYDSQDEEAFKPDIWDLVGRKGGSYTGYLGLVYWSYSYCWYDWDRGVNARRSTPDSDPLWKTVQIKKGATKEELKRKYPSEIHKPVEEPKSSDTATPDGVTKTARRMNKSAWVKKR